MEIKLYKLPVDSDDNRNSERILANKITVSCGGRINRFHIYNKPEKSSSSRDLTFLSVADTR